MTNDSALARGIRTAIQAFLGFLVGLFATIWAVPGVPAATLGYLQSNSLQLAIYFGIPAGVVAFAWNVLRKDVPNV